jgi:hypothetical protein
MSPRIQMLGSGGVADHGALTGLSDNDHPQYLLDDGDTLTGTLIADRPTGGNIQMFDGDGAASGVTSAVTFVGGDGTSVLTGTVVGQWVAASNEWTLNLTALKDAAGASIQIGNFAAVAKIKVLGHVVPSADNTYSLGESAVEFKDLFIDGQAKIDNCTCDEQLIIPSGTADPASTVGSLFLRTDLGTNGTVRIYANGAWRTVMLLV